MHSFFSSPGPAGTPLPPPCGTLHPFFIGPVAVEGAGPGKGLRREKHEGTGGVSWGRDAGEGCAPTISAFFGFHKKIIL